MYILTRCTDCLDSNQEADAQTALSHMLKYVREACTCQNKPNEFSLGSTIFQANVTQTEQNSSIDKMKHLFIYVCCIVSVRTCLAGDY